MRGGGVVVVVVVVLAGCSGALSTDGTPPAKQPNTAPETQPPPETVTPKTETPTATLEPATPSPTPTASPTPLPDNPWRTRTLVVGMGNDSVLDPRYRKAVIEAVTYWNTTGQQYSDFEVALEYRPNATSPDVRVQFVDEIERCGTHTNTTVAETLGCAPINDGLQAQLPQTIRIVTGYTNESTTETVKHEFGHILGRNHGEEPMPLMAARGEADLVSTPNATERPLSFQSSNLTYYVDTSRLSFNQDLAWEAVGKAMRYYEAGGDGTVPSNLTLTRESNESAADIVIRFETDQVCTEPGVEQSCGRWSGRDLDTDDSLEYYANATININEIPNDRWSWHTGYWLGYLFGASGPSDLPHWFQEADIEDREEWFDRACPDGCTHG